MRDLDLSALSDPYDAAAGRDAPESAGSSDAVGGCVVVVLVGLGLSIPGLLLWMLDARLGWVVVGVWLVVALLVARSTRRGRQETVERRWRLARLARDNDVLHAPQVAQPSRPGTVFDLGINRHTRDQLTFSEPRAFTVGRHTCTAGYRNAVPMGWGFATTRLHPPAPLPRLILVARTKGRRHSPVPVGPATPVAIELAGPGADAFAVHGPMGARQQVQALLDATLFRPDVLALLTERLVDLELVDGHLVVHAAETVGTDPDTWRWVLRLITTAASALEEPIPRSAESHPG